MELLYEFEQALRFDASPQIILMTPKQAAGFLIHLEDGNVREAYRNACRSKANSTVNYKQWRDICVELKIALEYEETP
jgi:hypothetical protein